MHPILYICPPVLNRADTAQLLNSVEDVAAANITLLFFYFIFFNHFIKVHTYFPCLHYI